MQDKCAEYALERWNKMRSIRAPFEQDWQDIRYYVRPVTQYATYHPQLQFYSVMPETCYDGTAGEALEELASALHSFLTNPAERWFEIQVEGEDPWNEDPDTVQWLQTVADMIYAQYQREGSNINLALHEAYMDLGSFGTCIMNQEWNDEIGGILFSARPLVMCYMAESSTGKIDTLCRHFTWSMRQLQQEFPQLPEGLARMQGDADRLIDMIHLVNPRSDRDPRKKDQKNKKYGSYWVSVTTGECLKESGYDEFPYHCARWIKLAGEVYGRGPAKKCLPDVKMLQQMERTIIKAGQKQVDPPLIVDNDSFMLPIRTAPGAIIYRENPESKVEPLEIEGNLPWGEKKAEQKRKFIKECFYIDWIRMEKENVEMTAYEVQDRRDEKLRLLAPIFGRVASELHGPMIRRSYTLMNDRRIFPPAPPALRGRTLKVGYMSPAAIAQNGSKAMAISRYIQDLTPAANINPNVMDAIDLDKLAQFLAIARGVPRTILRGPREMEQVRQQRQQQQQLAQAAQTAEPISKSMKNLADAGAKSPGGDIRNLIPGGGE